MSESTALTVPGLRLRNPLTGRHSWLSLAADGTFAQSQQNNDESHVPSLLTPNPIVTSQPTIFGGLVAGRWYSITIGFDGYLATGSTVALQSGSGQLYGTPYVGGGATAWAMTFYYMPQPNDVLRFTVYSRDWTGSAVRRWSPLTGDTGPQLLYSSPSQFYNGVATWATVGFTKPVTTVTQLYPADANGLAAGSLQSFTLSGDGRSAVILITIGATATSLRIVNANGADGSYTWYHDLPITRLVSYKGTLADVKTPAGQAVVAGTPIDITFTFGEQLAAFGPTVTAGGGSISNLVFTAPSDTAIVTFTPGEPGTQTLEIFTRDELDGSEGTITHSFTAAGPPAIVAGSISPSQFVDGWPTETTLLFDKAIASIGGAALVNLGGAAAGSVSGVSINGSMVTLTTTAAATSNRLVFTNVLAADGTNAASLEAPITRQAPTAPLLNSAEKDTSVLADFVTGSQTSVSFTFSEPLLTFTPSISAGGGTINAISFTAPSTTASIQITPGPTPGLNSLSIYIRDNVDGGSDTLTYSFTARAPVLATIVSLSPASLATGSATDVIVTFSEPIASIPIGGVSLTGAGTLDNARFSFPYLGDNTKARVGVTSTSVTAVTFAGIVDVNEGATASPSASITTAFVEVYTTGDRSGSITVTANTPGGMASRNPQRWVDGTKGLLSSHDAYFESGAATNWITFALASPQTFTGFKVYLDGYEPLLVNFYGVSSGGALTLLKGSFALSNATTQTHTFANSTAFPSYRLAPTGANGPRTSYVTEVEFILAP